MELMNYITSQYTESIEIKKKSLQENSKSIIKAIELLLESFKNGKKLLIVGNGGSAADAQHIATEFMIRLSHDIKRPPIPAIALTTDTSNLTAGGNDIGYENVFARNLEGLGQTGDVLLAISTSGNSKNVLLTVEVAKAKGIHTIGLLGCDGGKIANNVDVAIIVPSYNTQRIQETHLLIEHIICESIEKILYGNN
ncbi:MAG TPA: D-sedoheptulose 7-phosphate isomerase [Ignavibacteriales bacterium]|nr:D-sedoheptulose 7-phosphate isomerase [Ignavibacteriales bacterium]HPD66764.1 D-sedoheptulose 7-phosphate isomerase [Ignavibacteriales bacterium]HPP32749.1 D-sedoheptulose 7-phosphate isomerase [Ignavibacteriales bacterium]HRR18149.1 D-sedoheptulose 7-phosphate isomerase [Ignavibacteriales bacterium]HRT99677.1 D-sedoheptulose 7-phosphate isomerase [Ignavibacteriales bacterium]